MGRKAGFDGGQKGKRNGGTSLNSIKLILKKAIRSLLRTRYDSFFVVDEVTSPEAQ